MVISPRRRRKRKRCYWIAGIALVCAISATIFWFVRRRAQPVSAPAAESPAPTAAPAPTDERTPSPTITPRTATPAATQAAAPSPSPEAPRTPLPTLPLRRSQLVRSLYQGSLSIAQDQARGELSLTYVNNGTETLYSLYLHLYPNTQVPGSLTIEAVALDGIRAYYTLEGEGTRLCVPLVTELRSGEAARLFLRFAVQIPKYGFGLALAGSDALPLLCVFPTAAVYENGWVTEATADPGRVDYAPLADWRLLIESARTPLFTGGNMQKLGEGRYLCTAQAALADLVLG